MEHVWSVLCANAVIDGETNIVSLQGVMEQLTLATEDQPTPSEAVLPIGMDFVSLWRRTDWGTPEEGLSRISVVSPTGVTILTQDVAVGLAEHGRFRNRLRVPFFPFRGFGVYFFVVEKQADGSWQRQAMIPLEIVQTTVQSTDMAGVQLLPVVVPGRVEPNAT